MTHGDDVLHPVVGARPARQTKPLQDAFVTMQSAALDPGGSSYLEYTGAMSSARYWVKFTVPSGSDVTASIVPLSTYPVPCAAPTTVHLTGELVTVVYLPDGCHTIAVMLSHVDPIGGSSIKADVAIWPQPSLVADTFERTVVSGWGVASQGFHWAPAHAAGSLGAVTAGAGQLPVGPLTGEHLTFASPVIRILAVGRFTDCLTASNDQILFDVGRPIILTKGGLLVASQSSYVQLDDFDACKPWYISINKVGGVLVANVWQATAPQPTTSQVTSEPTSGASDLEVDTVGSPPAAGRDVLLDWIYFENEPYG